MSEQLLTARELQARGMTTPIRLSPEKHEADELARQEFLKQMQELTHGSQE